MGTGGIRLDGGDGVSSHLQIIAELEALVEMQARTVRVLATRLAELGDTVTGRDEIAEADDAIHQDCCGKPPCLAAKSRAHSAHPDYKNNF